MARYLLDTNIVSFQIKASDPVLARRFCLAQENYPAISAITEAEMRFGLALLPAEAELHAPVQDFLQNIEIEVWDPHCAEQYAQLAATLKHQGRPLDAMDTLIAAHALAHDFTLVSNDAAFRRVKGLKLEDWTKGPQRA